MTLDTLREWRGWYVDCLNRTSDRLEFERKCNMEEIYKSKLMQRSKARIKKVPTAIDPQGYYIRGCIYTENGTEQVEDHEADFWDIYYRYEDGDFDWIEWFDTRKEAEEALEILLS